MLLVAPPAFIVFVQGTSSFITRSYQSCYLEQRALRHRWFAWRDLWNSVEILLFIWECSCTGGDGDKEVLEQLFGTNGSVWFWRAMKSDRITHSLLLQNSTASTSLSKLSQREIAGEGMISVLNLGGDS